ncbi:MAG TPA: heme ABC exporter ATP-binding protein CcmA [Nitrososphaerales archaeon]|nr:heme ABC exporter ATP-binding protein CcmA [Nitrososphaerales archaeon]
MIEVENLSKKYGKVKIIYDLSFKVEKGEVVVLLGPNGAGKSTLLKCILGLVRYNGEIRVNGLDVKKKGREIRRNITYIPQQFILYPNLTVEDNLKFYANIRGISQNTVNQSIEKSKLEHFANKRTKELSEGLRQRLMLAIVSLTDTPILLFDEPTSNLDFKRVLEFKEMVKEEAKNGKTILLSTHLLSDINDISEKVIVMNNGKFVFNGNSEDLLKKTNMKTEITLTIHEELNNKTRAKIKDLLHKAGVENESIKNEFLTISTEASRIISVLKAVEEAGLKIKDFRISEPSLAKAFLEITNESDER